MATEVIVLIVSIICRWIAMKYARHGCQRAIRWMAGGLITAAFLFSGYSMIFSDHRTASLTICIICMVLLLTWAKKDILG